MVDKGQLPFKLDDLHPWTISIFKTRVPPLKIRPHFSLFGDSFNSFSIDFSRNIESAWRNCC